MKILVNSYRKYHQVETFAEGITEKIPNIQRPKLRGNIFDSIENLAVAYNLPPDLIYWSISKEGNLLECKFLESEYNDVVAPGNSSYDDWMKGNLRAWRMKHRFAVDIVSSITMNSNIITEEFGIHLSKTLDNED
jgi:hypothetical protein